jgi:opacity protein-like surface antigen
LPSPGFHGRDVAIIELGSTTGKSIRSLAIYTVSFLVLSPFAVPSGARADDGDLQQVLKALKTLESRVATLESENQHYKRDAASARAEAQALKQKLGGQGEPKPGVQAAAIIPEQHSPSASYTMATKAPLPAAVPSWGGFYAGASFGIASQRAHKDETDPSNSTETSVQGTTTDTFVDSSNFTDGLGGRGPGAMVNLYLGYNRMVTDRFLLGAQIEGGVSNIRTRLTGPSSDLNNSVDTFNTAGVINTQTSTSLNTGNATDTLNNRWSMSALLRGGVLADPKDLIYVIGGLSYARFEFGDQTVGAFGGTVGAGWERKITPSWTLKAEYRYTRFQDRTVATTFNNSSLGSTTTTFGGGPGTSTDTSTEVVTQKVSGLDWQTVMVGVSHYFDAD